eukprot:GHVU01065343.1.p3 GENE.GHVU01065343.1~~GHVU01065343.1.p3  ORF type:complete len:126 (-),score=11.16 GHVU01065343.1:219-596(-)
MSGLEFLHKWPAHLAEAGTTWPGDLEEIAGEKVQSLARGCSSPAPTRGRNLQKFKPRCMWTAGKQPPEVKLRLAGRLCGWLLRGGRLSQQREQRQPSNMEGIPSAHVRIASAAAAGDDVRPFTVP